MCTRITCSSCNKESWEGCGEHVEEALYGVPDSERCQCHN